MEEQEAKVPLKKPVKIGLWLLGFAVLGLLGLWLEHERAKARLAAFKAQLIAKGEKLAIADHVPKLPPALSNAAPDLLAAANRLTELKAEWQPLRMRMIAPGRARVTWRQAELPTEKEADIWPFIIAHVEDNRPLLAEMAAALERPEMVFNLDYSKGVDLILPHIGKHKTAVTVLANAALVDLRAELPAAALTNLLAAIRLVRLNEEPLLISQLVRVACGYLAFGLTWEAMQASGWDDRQLATIQSAWMDCNGVAAAEKAWSGERAWASNEAERMRQDGERAAAILRFATLGSPSRGAGSSFFELLIDEPAEAAKRIVEGTQIFVWRLWLSYPDEQLTIQSAQALLDGARTSSRSNSYQAGKLAAESALARLPKPNDWFLLSREHPFFDAKGTTERFARFEAVRRLTFTAIALHRHRLKHGKFPASLGALVPEFLAEVPRDFMDGQPLRYQLDPDGQFRLWSVGEDFKDDGGDATTVGAQSTNPFDWLKGRDWVWPQPATEAEVAAHHAELAAKRALTAPKPPP